MEIPGMLQSSVLESVAGLPASLSDPKVWGPILAIFVLVVLYSIVSSVNRLRREIASFSSELSAVRSTLQRIQWSVDRLHANRPPDADEEKTIGDLLFRFDDDRREGER